MMLWIVAIALFVVAVAAPGGPLFALGLLGGGYFLSIWGALGSVESAGWIHAAVVG